MNYVSEQNIDNIVKGLSNKIAMSVSNGSLIGDTTPVGTVISFMGTQAPLYYLVCDGTTYNIVDYVELANFIEAQFGSKNYFGGDGTTTFAVPDLRGEFLRGTGTNSHANQGSGANVGVHQDGTNHVLFSVYQDNGNFQVFGDITSPAGLVANNTDFKLGAETGIINKLDQPMIINTGDARNNYYTSRPTNTSVLYCIKYTKAVIPSEYEDGTPVGRVVFDCILREGYIKANGAQIEDATIAIPRLLSFVQKYSSQILAPDQATYEANVGLYLYDSTTDTLTLPNYIGRYVAGGDSISALDAQIGTHAHVISSVYTGSSDFYGWKGSWPPGMADPLSDDPEFGVGFTRGANYASGTTAYSGLTWASKSGHTIYDDSGTTRPKTITMIPQIRY